jgi:hypothetical protein
MIIGFHVSFEPVQFLRRAIRTVKINRRLLKVTVMCKPELKSGENFANRTSRVGEF